MSEEKFDLLPLLNYIDPATLSYEGWLSVGMALKHEGYTAADWDNWSQMIVDTRNSSVSRNGIPSTRKQELS